MNITFCDVCGSEISREIQPNGSWQYGDTREILCLCSECIEATSVFLRGRTEELGGAETITFEVSPEPEVTVEEVELIEEE